MLYLFTHLYSYAHGLFIIVFNKVHAFNLEAAGRESIRQTQVCNTEPFVCFPSFRVARLLPNQYISSEITENKLPFASILSNRNN